MSHPSARIPPLERLKRKVVINDDGCWIWSGGTNGSYGMIRVGSLTDGTRRYELTHRLSYMLHKGLIPDGHFVCHACDVKLCANPEHLFVGTSSDNLKDYASKGGKIGPPESVKGSRQGRSILREEHIPTIRALISSGVPQAEIGRRFGVTKHVIYKIAKGVSWKHVD